MAGLSMYANYKRYFHFEKMLEKMVDYAKSCKLCQRVKTQTFRQTDEMNVSSRPVHVLDQVASDYLGPINTSSEGYKYILIFIDVCSHFMIMYPCKSTTSLELCEKFLDFCCKFGKPQILFSDRGSCYTSDQMKTLSNMFGFGAIQIFSGSKRSNGISEVRVRYVKKALTKFCSDNPENWPKFLGHIMYVHNNSTQVGRCNATPYKLFTGRDGNVFPIFELPQSIRELNYQADYPIISYYKFKEMIDIYKEDIDLYNNNMERIFNKRIKHKSEYYLGSLCFYENNVQLKGTGFTSYNMARDNFIGPLLIGFIKKNKRGQVIALGLLTENLEPKLFQGQRSSLVTVRRVQIGSAKINGMPISHVELPRKFKEEDWLAISNKDKIRHKISQKASKYSNKQSELPKDYYMIEKILDSRFDHKNNEFLFKVKWRDHEGEQWIAQENLLDKSLISDYVMTKYKLKKVLKP
jgi:hypothetical protein